jgi:AraC-like DNA-binding protein
MFKSSTLFVIGAGASKEAGLPLGNELTEKIAGLIRLDAQFDKVTSGDYAIFHALKRLAQQEQWAANKFLGSGREVAEAMDLAQSIDTFLESHSNNREYVQLGKLGIVRAIALSEASCKLRNLKDDGREQFRLRDLADTWYYSLARQLFTGVPASKPERAFENVSFIVFNYDRCLQRFLKQAAQIYFRLNEAAADDLISGVDFIHPYGSLGSIFHGATDRTPFASTDFDVLAVANRIKTFSESCDTSMTIRQEVFNAETLIFLGFGFHDQNVALLDIAKDIGISEARLKRVFATTMGMSTSDEAVIRDQISYALHGRPLDAGEEHMISTNRGTCAELFSTYWRSLTA